MTRTGFICLAFIGTLLGGCVVPPSVPLDSQRAQFLLGMDIPTYYSTVSVATSIAERCNEFGFNSRLEQSLNSLRNEAGRGSRAAETRQLEIMSAAKTQRETLEEMYGVSFNSGDLCTMGYNEREANTAVGTLLVPQFTRITGEIPR